MLLYLIPAKSSDSASCHAPYLLVVVLQEGMSCCQTPQGNNSIVRFAKMHPGAQQTHSRQCYDHTQGFCKRGKEIMAAETMRGKDAATGKDRVPG
jgi:hypothetical protein